MLYIAPQQGDRMPGVLIAHGFAGSKQLMLGYAYVLAHEGYAVMLWDFQGHGANAAPLERQQLQQDLDIAYTALVEQPQVDPARLALLGHSMGSGVVISASVHEPKRFVATVAISPTNAKVTPQAPHNLQLQAGSWEGRFVSNAVQLLMKAGGASQNLAGGQGRELVVVPNAEHISILFRDTSHQAALKWLDATFGISHTSSYVDRRMVWYGLQLLAWLLVLSAVAPILAASTTTSKTRESRFRSWGGLFLAPLAAGGGLVLVSRVVELRSLGGVMVGGAVGIWFLVAGLVWLSILAHLPRPTLRTAGLGVALFILLWIAFGSMAQVVWLQWWLIPARLKLWPLLSLACFPWFLASGVAQQNVGVFSRVGWWLGQSTAIVGGLFLTLSLLPQLGFIFLLLPLFPLFVAIFSLAAAQLNGVWSYALGSTLFFGWVIAAAFPLIA
jgi:dienelactone hydrolase